MYTDITSVGEALTCQLTDLLAHARPTMFYIPLVVKILNIAPQIQQYSLKCHMMITCTV